MHIAWQTVQKEGDASGSAAAHGSVIDILTAHIDEHPSKWVHEKLLAGAYNDAGNLLDDRNERIEWSLQKAAGIYERLLLQNPGESEIGLALTNTLVNIANSLTNLEKPEEAIATWKKLIEIREEHLDTVNSDPEFSSNYGVLANSYSTLAELQEELGELRQAIAARCRAVSLERAIVDRFPERVADRYVLQKRLHSLGHLLHEAGNAESTKKVWCEAISLWDAAPVQQAFDLASPMGLALES